jgi:hypothetical protein
MPIHDWSRVFDGAFHHAWIAEIQKVLNSGILPPDYYALAEQVAGATTPSRVGLSDRLEVQPFTRRQWSVVIHHASAERIIAVIEIVSAGNKSSRREFQASTANAVDVLDRRYHLLLIDRHPWTDRDPEGIHPVIWAEVGEEPTPVAVDKPFTLVAYDAEPPKTAYVERVAVGDVLMNMPLFLAPGWYVSVPLEATYQAAWSGVPRRYRAVLEPGE